MLDSVYAVELEPGVYVQRAPTPWMDVLHASNTAPKMWKSRRSAHRCVLSLMSSHPNARVVAFKLVPVEAEK